MRSPLNVPQCHCDLFLHFRKWGLERKVTIEWCIHHHVGEIFLRDPRIALADTHLTEPVFRVAQSGLARAGSGGLSLVHL